MRTRVCACVWTFLHACVPACVQARADLEKLLSEVKNARDQLVQHGHLNHKAVPPLLVKIAPDLSDEDKKDIADVVLKVGRGAFRFVLFCRPARRPSVCACMRRDNLALILVCFVWHWFV